jgi:hypothetical protein
MTFVFGFGREWKRIGAMIVCATSLVCVPAHGADSPNAQEILAHLIQSEKALQDIQAHVKTTIDGKISREFDWGYDRGREFHDGCWNGNDQSGRIDQTYSFDGDKEYHYMSQNLGSKQLKTGLVTSFDPANFNLFVTPKTLMGYSVSPTRQESLGQSLSRAAQLTVAQESCDLDGNRCCLLEALALPRSKYVVNLRVWIDEQRDYRPLKIEVYINQETPWERLRQRIDKIVLEKVGGMWLPVSGERESFAIESTEAGLALRRMGAKQHIDVNNVRVNEGIDPQRFKVTFPVGCAVLDEIAGVSYVVGGGKTVDVLADGLSQDRPSDENDAAPTAPAVGPNASEKSHSEPCSPSVPQQAAPAHIGGKLLSRIIGPVAWLCLAVISLGTGLFVLVHKKTAQKRGKASDKRTIC